MTSDRRKLRIELIPDTAHCIETVARGAYDESLGQYFRSEEESSELEQKIELLRLFLESMDFAELRRISEPHLTAGRIVKFVLYPEEGRPRYEMEVTPPE